MVIQIHLRVFFASSTIYRYNRRCITHSKHLYFLGLCRLSIVRFFSWWFHFRSKRVINHFSLVLFRLPVGPFLIWLYSLSVILKKDIRTYIIQSFGLTILSCLKLLLICGDTQLFIYILILFRLRSINVTWVICSLVKHFDWFVLIIKCVAKYNWL